LYLISNNLTFQGLLNLILKDEYRKWDGRGCIKSTLKKKNS
jgi:hypothetical protein